MPAGLTALLCTALLASAPATAQEDDLQPHIDGALSALQQLDSHAESCLLALASPDSNAQQPCATFLAGIDGELLAQYLLHCDAVSHWREQYVTATYSADQDTADAEAALRRLVAADFACGENALRQRTQFVVTAFNRLQQAPTGGQQDNTALSRRLAELQFDATLTAERRLLQNSVQQQQLQQQREMDRQRQQMEMELIRQQQLLPNQ